MLIKAVKKYIFPCIHVIETSSYSFASIIFHHKHMGAGSPLPSLGFCDPTFTDSNLGRGLIVFCRFALKVTLP